MSNLIRLSDVSGLESFDYNQITDAEQRQAAESICENYDAIYFDLKEQASEILKTNTVELSNTVFKLKHALDHGNFTTVCQYKYGLNKDKQAALVAVGTAISHGDVPDDALAMLSQTEPRAAQKFLKADSDTKTRHVATFEETGKAPSRRSFSESSRGFLESRQQQERMDHNRDRMYAEAFSDSPASAFYKGDDVTTSPGPEPTTPVINVTPSESQVEESMSGDMVDSFALELDNIIGKLHTLRSGNVHKRTDLERQFRQLDYAAGLLTGRIEWRR